MAPSTMKQWNVGGRDGFDSLKLTKDAKVPELRDHQVLVKWHAASLNYRDLVIPKGQYPMPLADNVIPGSDGAGVVEAVGPRVTRWKEGDKVTSLFTNGFVAGDLNPSLLGNTIGGSADGVLREYSAYDEGDLVPMPKTLNFQEAATLPCAAVTAWDALYGLPSKALKPGQTVLVQGTGGVSIFALQFAKAAGARVIATTSSEAKTQKLKSLGADHVINYKTNPSWGQEAKENTPDGWGVDIIVEVGGPATIEQSFGAIKMGGVITIIGFIAGQAEKEPSFLTVLRTHAIVRGILVGSRTQAEDMGKAIDASNIKPVVDEKSFKLDDLKEAYQYMWDQKHFGKLSITY